MLFSKEVIDDMERRLALMIDKGVSRKLAALKILESKEGWYVQTPEGEYLLRIISPRESVIWSSA